IPRLALSEPSIGSTTTRRPPSPRSAPTSSETRVAPSIARSRWRITRSAAASIAIVSSPPSPAPTTGSRSARVGSSCRTACTSPTAARQTSSQSSAKRQEEQAGDELRVEVRALLRHRLAPFGDGEDVLDPRGPHQHGDLGVTRVDRADGLPPVGRVADPLVAEPVDEPDVERLGAPVGRETPQPRALDLEVRLGVGPPRDRLALVEEEERLQLRAGLTEQAQTAFLRAAVCALVGQDDPRLVRLGPQRGHEPLARTRDLLRADVVLRQPPDALGLVLEHSVGAPLAPEPARFGLVVGQRQMDYVVRARGAEALALLGR